MDSEGKERGPESSEREKLEGPMKPRAYRPRGRRVIAALLAASALILWAAAARAGQIEDLAARLNSKYAGFDRAMNNVVIKTLEHSAGQVSNSMTIYRKGDKLRIESTVMIPGVQPKGAGGLTTVLLWDGASAWMITPSGQKKIPGVNRGSFEAENNWWKEIAHGAKITGEQTVNGRQCYVMENPGRDARFCHMWIDKRDLVMVKAQARSPEGKKLEWLFSDFKKTGGWEVPFRTETFVEGQPVSTSVIQSYELGRELPDSLFEPASGK